MTAGSRPLINPPLESRSVTKTLVVSRPRITALVGDIEIVEISVTGRGALASRQPRTRIEAATARARPLDRPENDITASARDFWSDANFGLGPDSMNPN